jgi:23S rRNA (uracil1939-C5)-methyltransferase
VRDAEINLADFRNVDLRVGAIEAALPRGEVDAAVVDPPRAGMKPKALEALAARVPGKIVYVSCDPTTLARDAKMLVARGYRLNDVQPVDLFPQTYHVESVALFMKAT